MKRRRSLIFRWVVLVALVSFNLALFQPGSSEKLRLGEWTWWLAIFVSGLALVAVNSGRIRDFWAGLAVSSLVVGLMIWAAPVSVRYLILQRVIFPIDARLGPRATGDTTTNLGWSLAWVFEKPEHWEYRLTRAPFVSRESQNALGCLELSFSLLAGLMAATLRPWTAPPISLAPLDPP